MDDGYCVSDMLPEFGFVQELVALPGFVRFSVLYNGGAMMKGMDCQSLP